MNGMCFSEDPNLFDGCGSNSRPTSLPENMHQDQSHSQVTAYVGNAFVFAMKLINLRKFARVV